MHIVDISEHNGAIDFDKMKQHADGVMIRLSLGFRENGTVYRVDNRAMENIAQCERVGLPWGVYHYSYAPHTEGAKLEALGVLKLLDELKQQGYRPLLPVAFDMEDNHDLPNGDHNGASFAECRDMCQTFVNIINQTEYTSMVYASRSWFQQMGEIKNTQRWVAEWDVKQPTIPCEMWQFSAKGDGHDYGAQMATIDLNKSFIDYTVPKGHIKLTDEVLNLVNEKLKQPFNHPENDNIVLIIGDTKWEFTPKGKLVREVENAN